MIYDSIVPDHSDEGNSSGSDFSDDEYDLKSESNGLHDRDAEWEDCGSSAASAIDRLLERTPGMDHDGTCLLGSPLARSWPLSMLNPIYNGGDLYN